MTNRAVVSQEAPSEPIYLAIYGPDGEVARVPLPPVHALELAKDLMEAAVASIKADWQG